MNKICTSIKQSKKLIELGIDANTADMYYSFDYNIKEYEEDAQIIPKSEFDEHFSLFQEDIPAWSFSALMNLIPKNARFNNVLRNVENDKVSWTFFCHAISEYTFDGEDDFECIYKTICWLKENGKI